MTSSASIFLSIISCFVALVLSDHVRTYTVPGLEYNIFLVGVPQKNECNCKTDISTGETDLWTWGSDMSTKTDMWTWGSDLWTWGSDMSTQTDMWTGETDLWTWGSDLWTWGSDMSTKTDMWTSETYTWLMPTEMWRIH